MKKPRARPKRRPFRWHTLTRRRNLVYFKRGWPALTASEVSLATGWGIVLENMDRAERLWKFFSELHADRPKVVQAARAFGVDWDAWPDGRTS